MRKRSSARCGNRTAITQAVTACGNAVAVLGWTLALGYPAQAVQTQDLLEKKIREAQADTVMQRLRQVLPMPEKAVTLKSIRFLGLVRLREDDALKRFRTLGTATFSSELQRDLGEDLRRLAAAARAAGYYDFEVTRIEAALGADSASLALTLTVTEGTLYTLGRIDFTGIDFTRKATFSESVLRETLSMQSGEPMPARSGEPMPAQSGEPLNRTQLEQGINDILALYERAGRPFATVAVGRIEPIAAPPDSTANRTDSTVVRLAVRVDIDEGQFVRIAGYDLRGETSDGKSVPLLTEPDVITRELPLKVGEGFNEDKFLRLRERLEKTGFFEKVAPPEFFTLTLNSPQSSAAIPNASLALPSSLTGFSTGSSMARPWLARSDTLLGLVRLTLTEGNTNNFDGVIGYQPPLREGDEGFFTGLVNISLRNLFGTGRRLDVKWNKPNAPSQEVRVRYQEPWLLGIPLTLTGEFAQLKQDSTFSQVRLALDGAYRVTETFFASASFSSEEITPISGEASVVRELILESRTIFTGFTLLYDTRDFPLSPTSGLLFRNDTRFGSRSISDRRDSLLALYGLSRSLSVQRIGTDVEWYQTTFRRQVVAAGVHSQLLISPEILFSDLFRFGGATSLRGYREQQFLASRYAYLNLEYRFLLSRKTFVFGFYDVGYYYKPEIKTLATDELGNPLIDASVQAYKSGFGIGARVESPLGIIGISYALGDGDGILRGKVHIGLQNEF